MAALSAAELQKRHELEGAPDPFPSLREDSSPAKPRQYKVIAAGSMDNSEVAFPSLAPSTPVRQTKSWGASPGGPRIAPAVSAQPLLTERFTLAAANVDLSGRDGRPATLGDALKQMSAKHPKVRAEASSSTTGSGIRETAFFLKSESAKELERAKRTLVSVVSPQASIILNAPASTIATIIGPRGATLKHIRDQTNVRIDIPRKEAVSPVQADGNGVVHPINDDEEEEPTVPITITGPRPMAEEAQGMLKAIVASKTSKTTQRIRDIPDYILPFVLVRRQEEFLPEVPKGGEFDMKGNTAEREIVASGDRELVAHVIDKIKSTIELLKVDLTSFEMALPKRQHRLLTGPAAQEILAASNCLVVVPRPEDPSEKVTVWGNTDDFANGMTAITQKAKSQHIHEFILPGPLALSKQIITYMVRTQYLKNLSDEDSGVSAHPPPASVLKTAKTFSIDVVGQKAKVDEIVQQLSTFVDSLAGGTEDVAIDWLLHRVLIGKYAKKIKQIQDNHNVRIFFPNESKEESTVLLVYDPTSPSASRDPGVKAKHLSEVEKELLKLARDAADVKSELIPVEVKWHPYVAGKDGTTLNAIIGEDKALSIKIGPEAGGDAPDFILVRGASADVDRAIKEIQVIVENAKNELIDNSYSTEFDVSRDFVGRIVGSHGSAINKLRETLGVKVDFLDEPEEKEKDTGKKKKAFVQKAKVKIVGRKENVEEAKRRILSQVERLADETSEVLKIPAQYHSSLIGQSGKYVIRLEEKYSVKITFHRETGESGEGKTRESLKPDEVLIKGGRKGVASAKAEILEAVEFEKETNNVIKFTVPTKSVARILGKGGANINAIKDDSGAQIDIDRGTDDLLVTNITCRGTKKAIAAAKVGILAIAEQVGQEVTVSLNIERRFHRSIIGPGGQGLRDLVTRCGGPGDPRQQASLIRFPHQSEPSDEVRLRGDATTVKKLQQELEKIAASLRDRVVLYVEVPNAQHRALIGRNGQHLNDLQTRTGAQVQFPGSRSYNQVGEAENAADFKDADPQNLVKVSGTRAACEKAIKEFSASVKAPAVPTFEPVTDIVTVPLKYHHFVSQQGNLFRALRSFGVSVDQSTIPTKSALPARPLSDQAASARIDDAAEVPGVEWQVVLNYQEAEEGDSVWTLKARDEAGLEKAKKLIADAIKQAEESTSAGFLTLPDRSAFPRIVGAKGANVSRLRNETGADITVSREDNTITIIGSESSIEAAKEAILRIHAHRGGRRGD